MKTINTQNITRGELARMIPGLLPELHKHFSFDFQGDFVALKVEGKPTPGSVEQLTNGEDGNTIIFYRKNGHHLGSGYYYFIYKNGKFGIDNRIDSRVLDYFYRLADMNADRQALTEYFIIHQSNENLKAPSWDGVRVDPNTRYQIAYTISGLSDGVTHYISAADVIEGNKKSYIRFWGTRSIFPNQIREYTARFGLEMFDKNGYAVYMSRQELANRLRSYKAEKRAAEAAAVDYAPTISELEKLLENAIQRTIKAAQDRSETLLTVSRAFNYLHYAETDIVRYKNSAREGFISVEAAKARENDIKKEIQKALERLAPSAEEVA